MRIEHLIANEDIANQATTHLYQRKIGSVLYPAAVIPITEVILARAPRALEGEGNGINASRGAV